MLTHFIQVRGGVWIQSRTYKYELNMIAIDTKSNEWQPILINNRKTSVSSININKTEQKKIKIIGRETGELRNETKTNINSRNDFETKTKR